MTEITRPGLRPLAESFPRSQKIAVGDLQVPARDIALTNGDVVRVYDTTGTYASSDIFNFQINSVPTPGVLAMLSVGRLVRQHMIKTLHTNQSSILRIGLVIMVVDT